MRQSAEAVRIRITPELLDLFAQHRLQTGQRSRVRWIVGDVIAISPDARIEPYVHVLDGHSMPAQIGAFSYARSRIEPTVRLGRYCSIAAFVTQMGMAHPTDWASTSPFSHNPQPLGGFAAYFRDRGVARFHVHEFDLGSGAIEIGHDVWIGEGALLKPGIRIGDGAIVAARAIVTRDVAPYAIVGGSPARLIRYRFPEAVVARLHASQWWRFGPEILQPLDVRNPEAFLDRFEQALADGIMPLDLPVLTGAEIIATGDELS